MTHIVLTAAAAFALIALGVWLFLTWYFADQQPMLGPAHAGRVTFKQVVQGVLRDIADTTRPLWMRVWLNAPFVAIMALDAVSLMQEPMRNAILGNAWGAGAFIALNLIARYGSTAAHAPVR